MIKASDASFRSGFHGYEPIDDIRWTTGDAQLPQALFAERVGPIEIELLVKGSTHYLDKGMPFAA